MPRRKPYTSEADFKRKREERERKEKIRKLIKDSRELIKRYERELDAVRRRSCFTREEKFLRGKEINRLDGLIIGCKHKLNYLLDSV